MFWFSIWLIKTITGAVYAAKKTFESYHGLRQHIGQDKNMLHPKDNQELILLFKNRDERAAGHLVELYGMRLYVAARLLCGNEIEAQDLAAETLQKAFFTADSFRGESSFFSWLYGILLNLNLMSERKRRRARLIYLRHVPDTLADDPPVGHSVDAATKAGCLAEALQRLPPAQQDVVLLRFYGELGIRDIAIMLNVKPGTVKSRLFTALRALKSHLPAELRLCQ